MLNYESVSVYIAPGDHWPVTTALYGAATGAGARPALHLSSDCSTTDCSALPVSCDLSSSC